MAKILIINPPSKDKTINRDMAGGLGFSAGESVVLPPLDLLNLVTTLRKKHYSVDFIDAVAERIDGVSNFVKLIEKKKYTVVIGSMALPTLEEDCNFYKQLKARVEGLKVIAKTGINYQQILSRALEKSGVDRIIFTECDTSIDEYINGRMNSGSMELVDGKVVIHKALFVIDDLDSLPIPKREAAKIELYKYPLIPGRVTTIQTSRGCPFACGYYCPYPLVQGARWRSMNPERVVKEIKSITALKIKNILFRDATFTFDMERTRQICELIIKKKIKINWWCETRVNVLTPELLSVMKKAGCKGINVGVETMDEELIKKEGKPGVKLEDVVNIRQAAKKLGIKLHFLMIVGLPNDNSKSLYNTFKQLVAIKPESVGITSITPYPGTRMFEDASRDGLISNFDWNRFNGANSNMKTKYLSLRQIELARKMLIATAYCINHPSLLGRMGIEANRRLFLLWQRLS